MFNKTVISDFYCVECGGKGFPLPRKKGQLRESGHLKKIFCLKCQKETNHIEVSDYGNYTKADFDFEFKMGRFLNGKRIAGNDLLVCDRSECEYCIKGRCWNAKEINNKELVKESEICQQCI